MTYRAIERRLPRFLRRHVLHFESAIEDSLASFSAGLPSGARVLDAGAGERVHARYFARQRYVAVDLAVGDAAWDYGKLDAIADLTALPFRGGCFRCLHQHRDAGTRSRAGLRAAGNRTNAGARRHDCC